MKNAILIFLIICWFPQILTAQLKVGKNPTNKSSNSNFESESLNGNRIIIDANNNYYAVLDQVSLDYPPDTGMLLTRYAPLRRSPASIATPAAPRLACVKPAASVHPEPGSNSSL